MEVGLEAQISQVTDDTISLTPGPVKDTVLSKGDEFQASEEEWPRTSLARVASVWSWRTF